MKLARNFEFCSIFLDDSGYKAGIIEAETAVKNLIMAVDTGIDRIQMKEFQKKLYNEMDPRCVTPFGDVMFTVRDNFRREICSIFTDSGKFF